MAKEKGLAINKDNEVELRKYLQYKKRLDHGRPIETCASLQEAKIYEGRNTRRVYSKLSNIFIPRVTRPHSPVFAPRYVLISLCG